MADSKSLDYSKLSKEQLEVAELLTSKLEDAGLNPDLFVPQAFHESSLDPKKEGPIIKEGKYKGQRAQGLFQFMPDTAKEAGVKDVFDVNQNADGMIRQIKKYMDNPNIGSDPKKLLSAWNAGPDNEYIKTGELHRLPFETLDYLDSIDQKIGSTQLPSPIFKPPTDNTTSPPPPSPPPAMAPVPFGNLTANEAEATALIGGYGGAAAGVGKDVYLGGKTALTRAKDFFDPNSVGSLERYSNKMLGKKYQDIPLKDLEDLTKRTIVSQHDVQEAVKDIHGGRPTYPSTIRVPTGSGAAFKIVPVTDPVAQGVLPSGFSPRIDISKYEYSPGVIGKAEKVVEGVLPVAKAIARPVAGGLGVAGSLVDTADALKRAQLKDYTGATISGLGAGAGTLATLGALGALGVGSGAIVPATVGALGLSGINAARDIYRMSPTERQKLIDKTMANLKSVPAIPSSGGDEALFGAIANQ